MLHERIDKQFPRQPPENDDGNREYKLQLQNFSKINRFVSQLQYRLYEGDGKALYILGISDSGTSCGVSQQKLYESFAYLAQACEILERESNMTIQISRFRIYNGSIPDCYIGTVRIQSKLKISEEEKMNFYVENTNLFFQGLRIDMRSEFECLGIELEEDVVTVNFLRSIGESVPECLVFSLRKCPREGYAEDFGVVTPCRFIPTI